MHERLALGTVQFGLKYGVANDGGRVSMEEVSRIITVASAAGVRTIDTAVAYGDSERVLGNCGVNGWQIVTKLPEVPSNCSDVQSWVLDQIEGSLVRLKVSSLYGVLLHHPDQIFGVYGGELRKALCFIRARGYAKKIGVSIYSPIELTDILSLDVFDLVQAPLNILDRRLEESGWLQRLRKHEVEVHVRSVFLQGLLLMPNGRRPEKFNRWSQVWDEWSRWLQLSGLSAHQACLRYVLSMDDVHRVVLGVQNLAQLQDILSVPAVPLPDLPQWPSVPLAGLINPTNWSQL